MNSGQDSTSQDSAEQGDSAASSSDDHRRSFIATGSAVAMTTGLVASYGTFASMAGRFLFPAGGRRSVGWQFVAAVASWQPGKSLEYTAPSGATVVIARHGEADEAEAFIALSSVCPHLGCRVHWESQNDRFFCPCHNGAFDRQGVATQGPPAKAGQSLKAYPLKIEAGLLYVEAPLHSVGGDAPTAVAQNDPSAQNDSSAPDAVQADAVEKGRLS